MPLQRAVMYPIRSVQHGRNVLLMPMRFVQVRLYLIEYALRKQDADITLSIGEAQCGMVRATR